MSEQNVDPEVNALADLLGQMKPRPATLDREALMFRAGQASAPRGWKWPLATFASTLAAIGLSVALLVRPPITASERIVYVKVPAPLPAAETTTPEPNTVPLAPETPFLVSHE